jgi:hypothetical protein
VQNDDWKCLGKRQAISNLGPRLEPFDWTSADHLPAVASCEEMLVKVLFNREPSVLTTTIIATEMPAAMSPYSIAVAADSSLPKSFKEFVTVCSTSADVCL